MVLWWIGNVILLVVVLPVVIFLLNRVLAALERVRGATDRIDRAERGEAVTSPATAASPASGVTLGIRAALMALRRVFRRFFVPYQATS